MSRFRLFLTPAQEVLLLEQCGHARYVGNLGLEQRSRPARAVSDVMARFSPSRRRRPVLSGPTPG